MGKESHYSSNKDRVFVRGIQGQYSLKEELAPRHAVIPDQFIDRTRHRPDTFFGDGVVAHVAFAEPICPSLASALATSGVTTRSASGPSRPPVAFRRTRRIPMATGIRVSATPIGHGSPVDGMEYTLAKWTAVHSQAERWPLTRPPRRRVRRREVSRTAGSSWIGRGHPVA